MTISDVKMLANRLNARRSTGPRTVSGKRRASQNALRHGLSLPASLFPPTMPLFEEICEALKTDSLTAPLVAIKEPKCACDSRSQSFALSDIREPPSDGIASIANTLLDLCRLRVARKQIVAKLIENPNDPLASRELESLLRYGRRLTARIKQVT